MRKYLLLLVLAAISASAQNPATRNPVRGVGAPSNTTCNIPGQYGNLYFDTASASDFYTCGTAGWAKQSAAAGTVTSVSGTSPIAVATGTTTPVVSLNDTAVTPAAYTNANITVDQKGRITAAASGSSGASPAGPGVPSSSNGTTFTDAANFTGVPKFNGTAVPTQAVSSDLPGGPYLPLVGGSLTGNLLSTPASNAPSAPVITQGGTPGSTTYVYVFTCPLTAGGNTLNSPNGSTTTGAATLNVTNFNIVTLPSVSGTSGSCSIWRTNNNGTAPVTMGLIGTAPQGTALNDTGLAGNGDLPPYAYNYSNAAGTLFIHIGTQYWNDATSALYPIVEQIVYGSGGGSMRVLKADGTPASPTTVLNGEIMYAFAGLGFDGKVFGQTAGVGAGGQHSDGSFELHAGGNFSATSHPTYWSFNVTGTSSIAKSEVFRISADTGISGGGPVDPHPLSSSYGGFFSASTTTNNGFYSTNYGTNVNFMGRRADGTGASPTAVQADEAIMSISGRGYGLNTWLDAADGFFNIYAAENFTNSAHGTYAKLVLQATGGTTRNEVFRAFGSGGMSVGTTVDPGLGQFSVAGLKTTGAAAGKKSVCVDTTTGILYASTSATDCLN